ncbi:MAG TPA: ribosome silencing factor [Dehalococcoidia bacterium]|nr:ribosome silencing factor [Dehalococcoidia bacterium]
MTANQIESSELARRIVDLLSDRQAEDIVLLDIHEIAYFTDFFVIATAQNQRHVAALIDTFDKELATEGVKSLHREGEATSGWVLVDFGGVIVHIFTPEERAFYNLEGLWGRAGVPAVHFQ